MKNKKRQDFLIIKFEKKNSTPEVYYKGEKIIGDNLVNDLYLEQLNLNYLTDTEYEHQLGLSLSGFQLADDEPTFLTKQFVTSLNSLDKTILEMKKNLKKEEKLKNENNGNKAG